MAERSHPGQVDDRQQEFTFRNVQLFKNETLGTGGYGAVCRAKCDQLICAAKLLYPVLFQMVAPDPGKEHRQPFRRFELECRFLSRVNHPNIVQYLGTYRDPETNAPVLLMELMDESLTHFLESSPGDIPYHIQVNLLYDITQALAFLHANGIIHRDLSSNNVLLIARSRAKVSDFGMSRFTGTNLTQRATLTTCPGTPAFMSPEALNEPPVYTEKLDTFSFGVLVVQMITRKFPEPSDRFRIERVRTSIIPKRITEAKIPIPEFNRRQAHIRLIDNSHPLLPIALECLKDDAAKRPSSQQLCQSLDDLKTNARFKESSQQEVQGILQSNRTLQHEIEAKKRELNLKDETIQEKDQQLQAKDEVIEIKNRIVLAKDEKIQALQRDLEAKEHQLISLRQQVETNEDYITALHHPISERDTEPDTESRNTIGEYGEPTPLDSASCSALNSAKKPFTLKWQTLQDLLRSDPSIVSNNQYSAVVGRNAYIKFTHLISEYNSTDRQWYELPKHPIQGFTLVSVEDELTTVGGYLNDESDVSNELYSYISGKWVERYPPMPTKRSACAAVYTKHTLIAAGGRTLTVPLSNVELLHTQNMQWSSVSCLPFSTSLPSASICGEHLYLYDAGYPQSVYTECSTVRCTISDLTRKSASWEKIASLNINRYTLVTVRDCLLAVGGKDHKGNRIRNIHSYDQKANSWRVISEMKVARTGCVAIVLPDNLLIVLGGNYGVQNMETATILFN